MGDAVDRYYAEMSVWSDEAAALRQVLLSCGLAEKIKWRKPCYGADGANICIVQPFKDMLALLFFKGALLDDPDGLLREQGDNTRSAKRLEFRSVGAVTGAKDAIRHLVDSARDVTRRGLTVERPEDDVPEELVDRLDSDAEFREAFEALTPGRQRGYYLAIGQAKKAETRRARIEKFRPDILAGKGIHDR